MKTFALVWFEKSGVVQVVCPCGSRSHHTDPATPAFNLLFARFVYDHQFCRKEATHGPDR